jgi:hypothetical protein
MNGETKSLLIAWYGLVATPVVSLMALQTKFAMVHWVCVTGHQWTLQAVAGVSLLLTASGGAIGYWTWQRLGSITDLGGNAVQHRTSQLVVLGTLMSIISTIFVIAMILPISIMGACD